MENKQTANYDFLIGLITIVLGIVYGILAFNIRRSPIGNPFAPSMFPFMLAGFMVLMGVIVLLRSNPTQLKQAFSISKNNRDADDVKGNKMISITVLSGIIYALMFEHFGYVISTIVFMMINLFVTEPEKRIRNLIVALIFSLVVYYVFFYMLGISLPMMPFVNW